MLGLVVSPVLRLAPNSTFGSELSPGDHRFVTVCLRFAWFQSAEFIQTLSLGDASDYLRNFGIYRQSYCDSQVR
jgi:hypothetical protein